MPSGTSGSGFARRLALLAAVVLASRVPFLWNGFGADADGWRVYLSARHFAQTGTYTVSRSLGFPLQEWTSALLWRGGAPALNGATALMSVSAVLLFASCLHALRAKDVLLPSLAFAAVPVLWVASVSSMDYLWALAFLCAALLCALRGRAPAAGLAVALSIGCRPTGIFLLPAILILLANRGVPARAIARSAIIAAAGGALFYLPVLLYYGPQLGETLDVQRLPALKILAEGTIGVWGPVGLAGLAVAIGAALYRAARPSSPSSEPSIPPLGGRGVLRGCAVAVLGNLALFLYHPVESAYLIPCLPFVFLGLGMICSRSALRFACLLICVSPFVGIDAGGRPVPGLLLRDRATRIYDLKDARHVLDRLPTLPHNSVLVVGSARMPVLKAMLPAGATQGDSFWPPASNRAPACAGEVTLFSRAGTEDLTAFAAGGRALYYLADVRAENLRKSGVDLAASGTVLSGRSRTERAAGSGPAAPPVR